MAGPRIKAIEDEIQKGDILIARNSGRHLRVIGKEYQPDLSLVYLCERVEGKPRRTRVQEKYARGGHSYAKGTRAQRNRVVLEVRTVLVLEQFLVEKGDGTWNSVKPTDSSE